MIHASLIWLRLSFIGTNVKPNSYRVMKKKIKVSYAGSGVHLTSVLSKVCFILALICVLPLIVLMAHADGFTSYSVAIAILLIGAISLLVSGALFQAISSIAKTALYQRFMMEQDYEFIEEAKNREQQEVRQIPTKDFFQSETNE